ncbi:MAG: hypothetical protein GC159_19535 [Phycisphaera sp.]|nr:hypothetical protein [Phycisphaera sp.]
MTWLTPWHPIDDDDLRDQTRDELRAELAAAHVLYELPVRAIAHRQDCDEILLELCDGTGRFAVVHLTYAQHPEPNPVWPETRVFQSWNQFEQEMQKENKSWGE